MKFVARLFCYTIKAVRIYLVSGVAYCAGSVYGETYFEIEYKLGMEIQNVKTWLDANKLTLNEEKTEYMLIG